MLHGRLGTEQVYRVLASKCDAIAFWKPHCGLDEFFGMFSQHALSDKACIKAFDPKTTCLQECLITTFQDAYFVSESFEEAKEKMR